jgi:peptidoglycan/LPS O-acetylase OafA/YrhL
VFPGGFGVTIFFFLSGYLITTLMRREHAKTGTVGIRNFYMRRLLRIFPPMYLTLALTTVVAAMGWVATPPVFEAVALQALHLTNYYLPLGGEDTVVAGTEVYWSLAVEEHFYLGFPFLAIWMLRRLSPRAQAGVLGAICAGVLAWRVVLMTVLHADPWRVTYGTDTRVDSILFGAILALAFNPMLDERRLVDARVAWAAFFGALVAIAATLLPRDPVFRETVRYSLQGLLLMPVYYVLITRHTSPLLSWLNWRPIRFLGVLSYSLYLVHYTAIEVVAHLVPGASPALLIVGGGAISLAYAYGMHTLIEQPLVAWRRRLRA